MDALPLKSDEGRGLAAISLGEVSSNLRSGDFRMGKPTSVNRSYGMFKHAEHTQGSETSQYLEEKRTIVIP